MTVTPWIKYRNNDSGHDPAYEGWYDCRYVTTKDFSQVDARYYWDGFHWYKRPGDRLSRWFGLAVYWRGLVPYDTEYTPIPLIKFRNVKIQQPTEVTTC